MKIVVLNGSPKGKVSVTLQYVRYIKQEVPEHDYVIHDVAHRIKRLEKDNDEFDRIIDDIKSSDAVLWAFPLYYMAVAGQYKRFIELIHERGCADAFKDKYAASLSTSIHFYDHTAHAYIRAISEDLEMRFFDFFSAEMSDLIKEVEQEKLLFFARSFFKSIEDKEVFPKQFPKIEEHKFKYEKGRAHRKISLDGERIVLLKDSDESDTNLNSMIDMFVSCISGEVEIYDIKEIGMKGGCLGCLHCSYDNTCRYSDGYVEFFEQRVKTTDILIIAGTIRDRYLSANWKMFFDRSFYNNHVPVLGGKQIGFIFSGSLSLNMNLQEIMEAQFEISQSNAVGFITDECHDSETIDRMINDYAKRIVELSISGYIKPPTFRSVAGGKIFRDEVYARMRFPFIADYKYYKRNKLFDFPQKNYKTRFIGRVMMTLANLKGFRTEVYKKTMRHQMVKPFEKLFDD